MTRQKPLKYLSSPIILALMLTLSACGFHLRGTVSLPSRFKQIQLVTKAGFSPFFTTLTRRLQQRGVSLVGSDDSRYVLSILNVSESDQMSARLGGAEAGSYNYTRTVRFSLTDDKASVLITPTDITVSKTYTTNVTQQLIANQKKAVLSKEMDQELADQILLKLTDLTQ